MQLFRSLLLAMSFAVVCACGGGESFDSAISKPEWYDSIDRVELNTLDDLNTLWRGKKRCCVDDATLLANNREFYKACYEGIVNNAEDEEFVVQCLWLMGAGADKNQRNDIRRFLVDNFADHKNRVDRCSNCSPGDTVARVTKDLARSQKSNGMTDEAILLLEDVMDRRGREVSPWVRTEIYQLLGELYLASTVTNERKDRMNSAYNSLNLVRREDNGVERRFERFEKAYEAVMAR